MVERITQSYWLKYIIESLILIIILGLFGGIAIGFVKGWAYASKGFLLPFLDILKLSVNDSLLVVFLFVVLFLIVFFALRYRIRDIKWICFIATSVILLPVFLFLGYKINEIYIDGFFEPKAIMWNIIIGIGFVLFWLLISIVLSFWTRSRILGTSTINTRGLIALVGIVLAFNISTYLIHRFHTTNSPNVVVLLIDCLRADHVSSYGYSRNTTPNIDKFLNDAVVFTQAISQSTFTKTSIASLFTSLYPHQHGVYESNRKDEKGNVVFSDVLGEEETTLAEILLQNKFLTVAWLQQSQLMSWMGFSQGFTVYNEGQGEIENINRKFTKWLNEIGKNNKFFAYIHYLDLHAPYDPKPPYDTMYGVYSKNIYSGKDLRNWGQYREKINAKKYRLEKKDFDQLMSYYDGLVTYIDSQVGLLIEKLKRAGLYDNTLIIITSDHGDGFWEHDFIDHGNTPYEELIRVPLIIKFPNSLYAGKVIENQVSLIDVMPTVLDFLNIQAISNLEGFSLMNYLDDGRNKNNKADSTRYAHSEIGIGPEYRLSVRTDKVKYIIDFLNNKEEFYDLSLDPGEQNNIIDLRQYEAEKLRAVALNIRRMALDTVVKREKNEGGRVILDNETIEELKALGYIQ